MRTRIFRLKKSIFWQVSCDRELTIYPCKLGFANTTHLRQSVCSTDLSQFAVAESVRDLYSLWSVSSQYRPGLQCCHLSLQIRVVRLGGRAIISFTSFDNCDAHLSFIHSILLYIRATHHNTCMHAWTGQRKCVCTRSNKYDNYMCTTIFYNTINFYCRHAHNLFCSLTWPAPLAASCPSCTTRGGDKLVQVQLREAVGVGGLLFSGGQSRRLKHVRKQLQFTITAQLLLLRNHAPGLHHWPHLVRRATLLAVADAVASGWSSPDRTAVVGRPASSPDSGWKIRQSDSPSLAGLRVGRRPPLGSPPRSAAAGDAPALPRPDEAADAAAAASTDKVQVILCALHVISVLRESISRFGRGCAGRSWTNVPYKVRPD